MSRMRALFVVALMMLGGCSMGDGTEGDCSARVRYEGSLYRIHNLLPQKAAMGEPVGAGDVVGCGGIDAEAVDRVDVRPIKGVDPKIAIGTRGEWRGTYIREELATEPSTWPQPLRG
jgi:hypothetical protein